MHTLNLYIPEWKFLNWFKVVQTKQTPQVLKKYTIFQHTGIPSEGQCQDVIQIYLLSCPHSRPHLVCFI